MSYPILDTLNSTADLKALPEDKLPALCEELRAYMIETVSHTGGHLASSLGTVELIVAMHRVFDSPTDKFIFDVGHQAYAHKILTGRREAFATLRQEDGISGFPKREESEHDAFNTGHASTALSAALGMARGLQLQHRQGTVVTLVGDGALTGGLAFEALDDLGGEGENKLPIVIILNDNEMSIAKNVGALNRSLDRFRSSKWYNRLKRWVVKELDATKGGKWLTLHMYNFKNRIKKFLIPYSLFEEYGVTYLGPIDGHDLKRLTRILSNARELRRPVLVHVRTQKGRGYAYSEDDPERFHGIAPFSVMTGKVVAEGQPSCSTVFGQALTALAREDARIVAITAAMTSGTGLTSFAEEFPDRFFDVGIAEEHAVTMAAGLAATGMRPVCAIYSSFLQRSYDELLHDVCLQGLPVVFAVDRAGLVGEDGETHQGVYDPAYLMTLPNFTIYSPATPTELKAMLAMALERGEPAALRYNRGALPELNLSVPLRYGKWAQLNPLAPLTVIATGTMLPFALWVARKYGAGFLHTRFLKPLDTEALSALNELHARILVVEESIAALGPAVAAACPLCRVHTLSLPNEPIAHATIQRQRERCGLTESGIEQALLTLRNED